MLRATIAASTFAAAASSAAAGPTFPLMNAAVPGLTLPWIGLGTGAYSDDPSVGYNGYPECWSSTGGCGSFARQAVGEWIAAGGRRLDLANSYQNQVCLSACIHHKPRAQRGP
jgi:hypothetical protein